MPALSLFQGGFLRTKNVINVFMQVWMGVAMLSLVWVVWGFSLTFGDGVDSFPFYGSPTTFFLYQFRAPHHGKFFSPCHGFFSTIQAQLFANFYMMFACVAPLIITGAYAERLHLLGTLVFSFLWEHIVFYPIARGLWMPGWLSCDSVVQLGGLQLRDFAGGIVIHTTAGFSALVVAAVLGPRVSGSSLREPRSSSSEIQDLVVDTFVHKRSGPDFERPTPHSIPLATVGTALLWMGWYGFNAGSAGQASYIAVSALTATTLGPSVSSLVWALLNCIDFWVLFRKFECCWKLAKKPRVESKRWAQPCCAMWLRGPSIVDVLNGVILGLAAITAGSGFMSIKGILFTAAVTPVICLFVKLGLQWATKIDDELDVFIVHGIAGFFGAVFTGYYAEMRRNCTIWEGNVDQLGKQFAGATIVAGWSMAGTFLICMLLFKLRWKRFFCADYQYQTDGLNQDVYFPYNRLTATDVGDRSGMHPTFNPPESPLKIRWTRAREEERPLFDMMEEGLRRRPDALQDVDE